MIQDFLKEFDTVRFRKDEQGKLWYHASDVCAILSMVNVPMTICSYVSVEHRRKFGTYPNNNPWYIDEYGVWFLSLRSNCKLSNGFRKWLVDRLVGRDFSIAAIPKSSPRNHAKKS